MQDIKPTTRRALISTANKVGLVDFATQLRAHDFGLIATGNTARLLKKNDIPVIEIDEITGFPELLDGRVKTLHPHIHAGILARRGKDDHTLLQHNIATIDLIVVNLYPFEDTINKPNCTFSEAIENIDIGGPTLLRAAAKNHEHVTVVTDINDYQPLIDELNQHGDVTLKTRQRLALKVFEHTQYYDNVVARYFKSQMEVSCHDTMQELNAE